MKSKNALTSVLNNFENMAESSIRSHFWSFRLGDASQICIIQDSIDSADTKSVSFALNREKTKFDYYIEYFAFDFFPAKIKIKPHLFGYMCVRTECFSTNGHSITENSILHNGCSTSAKPWVKPTSWKERPQNPKMKWNIGNTKWLNKFNSKFFVSGSRYKLFFLSVSLFTLIQTKTDTAKTTICWMNAPWKKDAFSTSILFFWLCVDFLSSSPIVIELIAFYHWEMGKTLSKSNFPLAR